MSADSPITLDEACKLYPGARYKVSTLRAADPVQPDMEG